MHFAPSAACAIVFVAHFCQASRDETRGDPLGEELGTDGHCDGASNKKDSTSEPCTLYLAQSSIPGAGFGVFTTRAYHKGDAILLSDAPSVAVTDRERHQPGGVMKYDWPQDDYFWTAYGQMKFEDKEVSEMVVTLGSLSNFHSYLKNVQPRGFVKFDDTWQDRQRDHGAGAFSYYSGQNFFASRDIDAGEEIFANYGENWLDTRGEFGKTVPRKDDFKRADKIIAILSKRFVPSDAKNKPAYDWIFSTIQEIVSLYDAPIAKLLPKSTSEFFDIAKEETLALRTAERRSPEWIIKNGQCLDNMVMKKSTIPQAGRGAFARRFLPKGSLVVPVPLLQIVERNSLNMYAHTLNDKGKKVRVEGKMIGKQLLLNYCFGHNESSMVLCPTTNAILINHCSSRQTGKGGCGDGGPNAEYRWSTFDEETEDWLEMSIEEIAEEEGRGLSLEIYATQDIQEGEEIFIDYGQEWEEAWEKHMLEWGSSQEGKSFDYTSVTKMNDRGEIPRTITEEERNPYPPNVFTACIFWKGARSFIDGQIRDGSKFVFSDTTHDYSAYWPCRVIQNLGNQGKSFKVEIFDVSDWSDLTKPDWWKRNGSPHLLTNYPRESIKFFTKPYTSDQHLPHAFRHHIGIRDDIFPLHWKNRPRNEETQSLK